MSTTNEIGNQVSVGEQTDEHAEDGFEVVAETPELQPTVEMEIQATVDFDLSMTERTDRFYGQTLADEERIRGEEAELERYSERAREHEARGLDVGRMNRAAAKRVGKARRREFQERAASVDPWCDPDRADPRELLSREELGTVNREAARLSRQLEGWSRAAISRRLAERVVECDSVLSAVVGVFEELQTAPGHVIPIAELQNVYRRDVSVEGEVVKLFEPSHPSIAWVGLLADETGTTKVTAWKKSNAPGVREGERIQIRGGALNFYRERPSIAVTGWTQAIFPERGRWWEQ